MNLRGSSGPSQTSRNDAKELRARLEGLGRSFAAGTLIAQGIDELPSAAAHRASIDRRRASISELQLRIVALARQLRPLERDLPGESALIVSKLPNLRAADRDEAVQVVNKLLEARLRVLRPLLHDLDQYLNGLVEMQARQVAFLTDIREMERYLRSRQPWVRNSPRVTRCGPARRGPGSAGLAIRGRVGGRANGRPRRSDGQARIRRHGSSSTILAAAVTLVVLRHWRRRRAGQGLAPTGRRGPVIILVMAIVNGLACATIAVALGWWLTGIPGVPVGLRALGSALLEICRRCLCRGPAGRALRPREAGSEASMPRLARAAVGSVSRCGIWRAYWCCWL